MIQTNSTTVGLAIAVGVFLIALVSSIAKVTNRPIIKRRWTGQLGMPDELRGWVAAVELAFGVALLFSPTMVIGAVGLTAYLGGAIGVHARVGIKSVCVYAVVTILLIWLSVDLRR